MNPSVKDQIVRTVVMLEELSKTSKENQIALCFYDIIIPLMKNDGYDSIIEGNISDMGIDIMCRKDDSSELIGVEFKRRPRVIDVKEVRWLLSTAYGYPYSRVIMISTEGFTSDCYRLADMVEPAKIELLDLDDIKNWVSRIETEKDLSNLEYENIIKIVSRAFIEKIAVDPDFLLKIEWRELEKTVAEIFEGLTFRVTLTPPAKDGGKDLILQMVKEGSAQTYIVEIKHWRSMQKVGQNGVKEFLKVICNEKREKGIFLSTYGFTENAFEGLTELERTRIRFGTENKIVSLCKTYLKVKSGIWTPLEDLQEVLLEQTI